ncbi:hypothetical protein Afil01_09030 [Actinorhabdospora filicis]|uniref:DUF2218 domain-containing protein n=1 Tax=Actinorhabdospora filicis TaxID=1785913 RepID=A0A9W6SIE3_9ACTN|nr:DUF2218 domain-containing protein [Actinorhabdospora filicis]GLZ76096.1 hypothetical protein Afil01_09030 [Actinorhabdospora filicis]
MPSSTAVVATDRAGRYIKQLCTHFAKKADSEFDDTSGRTVFEFGVCDYRAEDGVLHLTVTGETEELLGRTEYVVADHLTRFGSRDGLSVVWART